MSTNTKFSWLAIEKGSLADKIMTGVELRFDYEEFVIVTRKADITPQTGESQMRQSSSNHHEPHHRAPGGKVVICFQDRQR